MKILVDACIFEHSLSFKGAWQNHGVQLWGNKLPVETGGIITKYAGKTIKASKGGDQNCALGALAVALSQPNNGINGYTTDALRFEQWHLGGNKFKETKYGDVQLFKNVKLEKIRTLDDSFTFQIPKDDVLVKLREYIGIQVSPLLKKVIDNLNQVKPSNKSSQDAWHITCMIERKLDIFLTTDTKLIGQIKSFPDRKFREMLLQRVMLPSEACGRLGMPPFAGAELTALAEKLGAAPDFEW